MSQLLHCDIKRVTKNQINSGFHFGRDKYISIVTDVSFPEVAHNQLSLTHIFSVFEKVTAFQQLTFFFSTSQISLLGFTLNFLKGKQ